MQEAGLIEKRRMERFNLQLQAIVMVGNNNQAVQTIKLLTFDVCAGGTYIKTPVPLPVGTKVALKIILSFNSKTPHKQNRSLINAAGSVARSDDSGMAICFSEDAKISPFRERDLKQ